MKDNSKQTGQHSADPAFLFQPPVQSDYPLLKHESEAIARQASLAKGWLFAFGASATKQKPRWIIVKKGALL